MADHADGPALVAQAGEQVEQLDPRPPVLPKGRLVEHQDRWRGSQRGRHRQAAPFAAGQRERVRLRQVGEVEALEQLVSEGYSLAFGARFLKRVIDDRIKLPLSQQWKTADSFRVTLRDGAIVVEPAVGPKLAIAV